ncbi:Cys-tRNA(Pro) deacylase [Cellulomonas bogoriensis]|uniref:Cys-tRNA(Pro)/Cys-tRNA(Cys) deacylase n=1 Tax=Cellulomonas bogoriensis 69B4 = DSM 16987 TaxID=1386082 RepID=A0A0A0C2I1_9CELL|nr:Cys-tRNA(Pro) deacylase [Cellulomonas bogoriensis]KGM14391.1 prolyl-tRNA synthetase [Cellulomonas bogoriensis 69B4 = DSM 16987]
MARRSRTVGTPALVALERAGVPHTVHTYAHDARNDVGYGLEAAQALGLPADHVLKTLMAVVDGALVVAVVPVTATVDLKALAAAVGGKRAAMADKAVAERATGYVVGGISPLGQRNPHPTVIDEGVRDVDPVYVSGGRRGLDVGLSAGDLAALTGARFGPLARR